MFEYGYAPTFNADYFNSPAFQQAIAAAMPQYSVPAPAPAPVATPIPTVIATPPAPSAAVSGIGTLGSDPAFDAGALSAAGLSAADIASLANWSPSDLNLPGLVGPLSGAGTYAGETKRFDAPTSNKGNPTSTVASSTNEFEVAPNTTVTVVDNTTGQVVYSGIGYDAAAKASEVAQGLTDAGGSKAGWDIVIDTPGIGSGSVAHEKINPPIGTMVLNAAVQIGVAVATAGMSIPAQAAIAAGTSAALTIAEGGSLTDAIKAGVMAAAPTVGAGYLGTAVQAGTNAAGKVVATTLGKAVAAGGSSAAMGLVTGQSLTDAIKSGAISAAGQVLSAELASKSPSELSDVLKNADLDTMSLDAMDAVDNISSALAKEFAANGLTASNLGSNVVNTVSNIGTGIEHTIITAPKAVATPAPARAPNIPVSGIVNAVQQTAANEEPEVIVTAKPEDLAPRYEVSAVPAPVAPPAGIGDLPPEVIVTAQPEDLAPRYEVSALPAPVAPPAGIGDLPPEVIVTAQPEPEPVTTPENIIVTAPKAAEPVRDESPIIPDIGPLDIAGQPVEEILKDVDKDVEEEKSILDYVKDAADVVKAVLPLLPLLPSGGGGGSSSTPGVPGPPVNPTVLTPTVAPESVLAAGGRYPYTPTTYGRAGGDQEAEYTFFTRAPGKKDGGEMSDDMVKHLVEYQKGSGHKGPGKVTGIGSGQEDLIPAWLSDGEYVWSAQDVADLGDGSTDEGVRRLDKMRQMVRQQAGRKDVKKIAKPQKGIDTMLKAVGGRA